MYQILMKTQKTTTIVERRDYDLESTINLSSQGMKPRRSKREGSTFTRMGFLKERKRRRKERNIERWEMVLVERGLTGQERERK
jgi:hypothetical protein